MAARSSSRLIGLLAVVVIGLVAWLVISLSGKRPGPSLNDDTVSATASAERPVEAKLDSAHIIGEQEPAPTRAIAERLATEEEGPTSTELSSAVWVGGRVIFPEGTPTDERATVVAVGREFGSRKLHRTPVAPDGTFKVAFAPSTKKAALRIDARYVFLEEAKTLKLGESGADVVLAPSLGGGLRGRVKLDASAQRFASELAGATISISGWKQGMSNSRTKTAKLDSALGFELGGLDPAIRWRLSCSAKGFATALSESVTVTAGRFEPLELAIDRGALLSGTVKDEEGRPVSGAQVHTDAHPRAAAMDMHVEPVSDKDGRFTYADLRPGEAYFVVEAKGFTLRTLEAVQLQSGVEKPVEVTLERGLSIAGVARFSDGTPANDVTVTAKPDKDVNLPHGVWFQREDPASKSDAEGKFTITGLVAGKYTVSARSAPKEIANPPAGSKRAPRARFEDVRADVAAGTTDLVLTLESGAPLAGRVVDDLGAPVPAFVAVIERQGANPWEKTGRREVLPKARDGRFEVPALADGTWEITAKTKEGGESVPIVLKMPEEARAIELVVPRPSKVRGIVLDPTGTPIAGATLRVDHSESRYRYWSNENDAEKSDEKGAFEVGTRPGAVEITAVHSNWAPSASQKLEVLPKSDNGPLTLRLRVGGTVTGRVLDRTDRADAGRDVNMWGDGISQNRTSDAEGRFRFEHVPPGSVQVSIQASDTELAATRDAQGQVDWQAAQPINGTARLDVVDGTVVDVVLGGTPKNALKVTGLVRAGAPLAGLKVNFYGPMGGRDGDSRVATTDQAGRYEVLLATHGSYSVSFEREDNSGLHLQVEIPAGPSFVYDITLPSGSIRGRVFDAQGAPAGGYRVQAYARSQQQANDGAHVYNADARTRDDGTFTLSSLSPATYSVQAMADHETASRKAVGQASAHEIELAEGAAVEGIVLRFPVTSSLKGRVRNRDGTPAAGARVVARAADSRESAPVGGGARTNSDGTYLIDGIAVGTYSVRAQIRQDTSQESADVSVIAGTSVEVNLTLEPGNTLLVSCTNADGKPAKPWCDVRDAQGHNFNNMYFGDEGDDQPPENVHRFRYLPDGEYTVRVRRKSKDPVEERVTLKGGVTREVKLKMPD